MSSKYALWTKCALPSEITEHIFSAQARACANAAHMQCIQPDILCKSLHSKYDTDNRAL